MVTKWLHVEMKVIDLWVLPIWKAVHRAVQEGRTTHPGDAAKQLALHLSTRLAMLPVICRRLNEGMGQLKTVIAERESLHEWTTEREGYIFPIPPDLQYSLLVNLDALLFELKACGELFLNFFDLLHRHAGKPIQKKKLWPEFTKVIEKAQDTNWLACLKDHRGFFIHRGTPYFAVDLSKAPERYDLLIMKENLRSFNDYSKFVRLSELQNIVEGFERSKLVLQKYLINLFSA